MQITNYQDLIARKLQLETIIEIQKSEIAKEFQVLKERTNPWVIAAQTLSGSFKDVKNNMYVNVIQAGIYLYKEFKDNNASDKKSIFEFIVENFGFELKKIKRDSQE